MLGVKLQLLTVFLSASQHILQLSLSLSLSLSLFLSLFRSLSSIFIPLSPPPPSLSHSYSPSACLSVIVSLCLLPSLPSHPIFIQELESLSRRPDPCLSHMQRLLFSSKQNVHLSALMPNTYHYSECCVEGLRLVDTTAKGLHAFKLITTCASLRHWACDV